ncbi:MAG: divalent-cation tolerance protein CutA [Vicinamibacteria bacterium]
MREHLVVLTTVGSEEDALRLARALLDRRLAACVNILPAVRSLYRFRGKLEDDREHLLVIKTRADRYDALAAAVSELHPYEVPELVALAVERGAENYLAWVDESVGFAERVRDSAP